MGLIQPDFSEEVKPPKPGTYRAKIVSAEQRTGKIHGTQFINWKLTALTNVGPLTVYHSTPIAGKGAGMFRRFLEAINPNYGGEPVDTDKLIGRTLRIHLIDGYDRNTGQKSKYLEIGDMSPDTDRSPFQESGQNFGDAPFSEDDIPY